jgi:ubiquinone/menaquinone biosynthesis C-methylase UbiE
MNPHDLVQRARPIGPADRILDLGCGTGAVAHVLLGRLGAAASITGVDVNPAMLATARAGAPGIAWVEGHAAALPFAGGSFELVLCQHMLQFAPELPAVLREAHRVLAPGGRLIASAWAFPHARSSLEGEGLRVALTEAGFNEVLLDTAIADVVTARRG